MAETAVTMLSGFCGPLTALTVTGQLPYGTQSTPQKFDLLPILRSLGEASSTLLSLALNFYVAADEPGTYITLRPSSPDSERGGIYTFTTCLSGNEGDDADGVHNTAEVFSLLSGCKKVTSLQLNGVCLGGKGWSALPLSLEELEVYRVVMDDQPPTDLGTRPLKQLIMNNSKLSSFVKLLDVVPHGIAISAKWLVTEECSEKSLSHIHFIVKHPALNFQQQMSIEGKISDRLSGVKGLLLTSRILHETMIWDFVSRLPVINTVTECDISVYCGLQESANRDIGLECLKHLGRVLPNIEHLHFTAQETHNDPLTDEAIQSLVPLTSLQSLKVVSKYGVSQSQFKSWTVTLPWVVSWEVQVEEE